MKEIDRVRAEAAGDAVRLWHVLDKVLRDLCEARSDLEDAGLEDLAQGLQGPIEDTEAKYDKAEREVARLLDGGAG